MKLLMIAVFFVSSLCSSVSAGDTGIAEFLKTRPTFKKMTAEEIKAVPEQYSYDAYYIDSAYRSERGHIVITALVRKEQIIGFHIQMKMADEGYGLVAPIGPIGPSGFDEALAKAYDMTRLSIVTRGSIGVNNVSTHHWILADAKEIESARLEQVEKLSNILKP